MKKLNLRIKNMVCPRCETVIRQEMSELNVKVIGIQPGQATVEVPPSVGLSHIAEKLRQHGFELLEEPDQRLVESIKTAVRNYLRSQEAGASARTKRPVLSRFLADHLGRDYSYMSKLFSQHEGHTLENYYIDLRLERVKELLDYGELSVKEIAHQLGYSSGHYLSAQFKKVTGQSITDYQKSTDRTGRRYLDQV